jgi:hypothetical protein
MPQSTKGTEQQNSLGPRKSGSEFLPDYQKGAEHFLN